MTPEFAVGNDCRVTVNLPSHEAVLKVVARCLDEGKGFTLATLNIDHLVKLRRFERFRRAYGQTDFVTADGAPVVLLSRMAGRPVSLAPGSELVEPLCDLAAARGLPVALFGSSPATLTTAGHRLCARHPDLRIALSVSPSYGFDPEGAEADRHIEAIRNSGARLCFVALGAPKQEIFAVRARAAIPACGFASIGAGLDFIAGVQRRAPRIMQRIGLEWVWRMASEPRRLTGRYTRCALLMPTLMLEALRMRRPAS